VTELLEIHGISFLACLVMLLILSYIGIHVLKREIIFIDIALAQIAAVGAIAGHVVFQSHGRSILAHLLALGATITAAAFFAMVRRAVVQIPLEAVIGVTYAVSAAAALFLVGVAPGGHVHVQGMLSGSVLWASWSDILWSTVVFAVVGVCFRLFRKPFRAISDDYDAATAAGYKTRGWDFFFYALVGIVVAAAVRVAGVVLVFAFLIMPATLSAALSAGWTSRLLIAWATGGVCTILGLTFADRFDFSVGPGIALFLGLALILVGLLRRARVANWATAGTSLAIAAVLAVWFVAGSASSGDSGRALEASAVTRAEPEDVGVGQGEDMGSSRENVTHEHLAGVSSVDQLREMYDGTSDAEERSMIVARWIEVDLRSGAAAAIGFLSEDPPLLFGSAVVEELKKVAGGEVSYDIGQPFAASANQDAVAVLKRAVGLE
jgi:zinc/manganese transport system permease protein